MNTVDYDVTVKNKHKCTCGKMHKPHKYSRERKKEETERNLQHNMIYILK